MPVGKIEKFVGACQEKKKIFRKFGEVSILFLVAPRGLPSEEALSFTLIRLLFIIIGVMLAHST